jgi:hypothetical protein
MNRFKGQPGPVEHMAREADENTSASSGRRSHVTDPRLTERQTLILRPRRRRLHPADLDEWQGEVLLREWRAVPRRGRGGRRPWKARGSRKKGRRPRAASSPEPPSAGPTAITRAIVGRALADRDGRVGEAVARGHPQASAGARGCGLVGRGWIRRARSD